MEKTKQTPTNHEELRNPRKWELAEPVEEGLEGDKQQEPSPEEKMRIGRYAFLFDPDTPDSNPQDAAVFDHTANTPKETSGGAIEACSKLYDLLADNPSAASMIGVTLRPSRFDRVGLGSGELDDIRKRIKVDRMLRYQLLELFQENIDYAISHERLRVPDQLVFNKIKRPNMPYYEKFGPLQSQEYSQLLALAMLDGTYDPSTETNDPIYNGQENVNGGQHRLGALRMISGVLAGAKAA